MLDVEPSKRPSAANILKHPWMTCLNPPSTQLVVTSEAHHLKVWPFFYSYCCWQQFVPSSAHSELKFRIKECENFTLPIYFQKSEEVAKISARKLLLRRRQFAYLIRFLTSLKSAVREPGGYILRLFYLHGYIQVDLIQTHSLSE